MRFLAWASRFVFIAVLAVALAGCPGEFNYSNSLSGTVSVASPLEKGIFLKVPEAADGQPERVQLIRYPDNRYVLLSLEKPDFQTISFFGPVNGHYIAEIEQKADGKVAGFKAYVVKIERNGTVSLADATANAFMAELLYERLYMITGKDKGIVDLTNDPEINWALLTELMMKYDDKFTFEPAYTAE